MLMLAMDGQGILRDGNGFAHLFQRRDKQNCVVNSADSGLAEWIRVTRIEHMGEMLGIRIFPNVAIRDIDF